MEENLEIIKNKATEMPDDKVMSADGENENVSFDIIDGKLFEVSGDQLSIIANFYLMIKSRSMLMDEAIVNDHLIDLEINFQSEKAMLRLPAKNFYSGNFMPVIWAKIGMGAILYGSKKTLVVATQEISSSDIPVQQVMTSHGFTDDGFYLSDGMKIAAEKISKPDNIELDLSGGNFSKRIGYSLTNDDGLMYLAKHLADDFLNLKNHRVTFPLMGHVCLAPFISVIAGEMGLKKPALHLEGSSGGGKTMLASLAMSFFGDFQDHFMSWTSTANAIEREGFFFRDSLFLIDDLKSSIVNPETVIRTLQNYVDGHGRARMKSNTDLQKQFYIRGLLLSTGEDFIDDFESLIGRTIIIDVEPAKNTTAGILCLKNRTLYRCFMPALIQQVISAPDWKNKFRALVNEKVAVFHALTQDLPNGLRISLNWALNYAGFCFFVDVIEKYGGVNKSQGQSMLAEYRQIAEAHIKHQTEELSQKNPVATMFSILQQKIQANQICITNLSGTSGKGKIAGTVDKKKGVVYLFPDLIMGIMQAHFHKAPFSKKALTSALAHQKLISRSENGRLTRQVRNQDNKQIRSNVWEIELKMFKKRCGLSGNENNEQNQGKED